MEEPQEDQELPEAPQKEYLKQEGKGEELLRSADLQPSLSEGLKGPSSQQGEDVKASEQKKPPYN
jgi:hypothetical protein